MKFQANIPFKLTKMFYEKLGEQPVNKRVLVIRDLFTAMHASIDNAVTFITDDADAYELFNKNVASNDEFGNDDIAIFVDTEINKNAWKDFIKELSNMPKFDVAIMNPPYDKNLHMQMLEYVKEQSNITICIHPANKFQNKIKNQTNLPFGVTSIELLEQDKFNELFGTAQWTDGCITVIKQNKISDKFTDFLHLVKNYDLFVKIKKHTPDYIKSHLVNEPNKFSLRYFVGCHWDKSHNFEGTAKSYDFACKTNLVGHTKYLNCQKEIVRKNLFKSGFTKFFKFCVYLDGIKLAPYMGDYTQPWDDKRFCEYFGITGYIDDDHAVPNSEWEIILNTIK